jgi:hypothetical protein
MSWYTESRLCKRKRESNASNEVTITESLRWGLIYDQDQDPSTSLPETVKKSAPVPSAFLAPNQYERFDLHEVVTRRLAQPRTCENRSDEALRRSTTWQE